MEIGSLCVRRSTFIEAPPARVWEEFTTFERMRAWFGAGTPLGDGRTGHRLVTYEPESGGMVVLEIDWQGGTRRWGGKIVEFEPGHEITFENDWIPTDGRPHPEYITIRLTPLAGGTHVELFHHGFERLGSAGLENFRGAEGGWTSVQLNVLRSVVTA